MNIFCFNKLESIMNTIQHKNLYSPLFTDDGGCWMLEAGGGWWRVCGALVLGQFSDNAQYRTISYIYTNIYCLHLHITHHNTYLNSYQLKKQLNNCSWKSVRLSVTVSSKLFQNFFTIELATPYCQMDDLMKWRFR